MVFKGQVCDPRNQRSAMVFHFNRAGQDEEKTGVARHVVSRSVAILLRCGAFHVDSIQLLCALVNAALGGAAAHPNMTSV